MHYEGHQRLRLVEEEEDNNDKEGAKQQHRVAGSNLAKGFGWRGDVGNAMGDQALRLEVMEVDGNAGQMRVITIVAGSCKGRWQRRADKSDHGHGWKQWRGMASVWRADDGNGGYDSGDESLERKRRHMVQFEGNNSSSEGREEGTKMRAAVGVQ
ncbi:hypothetical protein BHE74_00053741 [Ensete ventricosum]|nr:hypothetical protein GW17_00008278 [Ensete ventricosum]RWW40808.1 hypothetical protein BHE74_00053741 [Ensete ventricosum]RZS03149.1 hypothetical protein BHM03_00033293 [Ensete ventricosum]